MAADADIPGVPSLEEDVSEPDADTKEEGATQLVTLIRSLWTEYVAEPKGDPKLKAASMKTLEKKLGLYKGQERDLYDLVVGEVNAKLIKDGYPAYVSNIFNDYAGILHKERRHYPPAGVKYWSATGEIGKDGKFHRYSQPLNPNPPMSAAATTKTASPPGAAPTMGSAPKRAASADRKSTRLNSSHSSVSRMPSSA